jgi:hypothetical protein
LASAAVILLVCAAVLNASRKKKKQATVSERGDFIGAEALRAAEYIIRLTRFSMNVNRA